LTTATPGSVLFVVNSARDHELSASWAITNNIPVLIEKPFTLSSESTLGLIQLAHEKSSFLASAHVFLFASYITRLKAFIHSSPAITSIDFKWHDSQGEYRYGDKKSFDLSLPVFADVFPHIYSILDYLFPNLSISNISRRKLKIKY
jgi:predicted dehydrogenase